jgi:Cd2+/Zn2+-exporting ATPase
MSSPVLTQPELSEQERSSISRRLGGDLAGAALLAAGALYAWVVPEQAQVGSLVQALGALVVGVPVLWRGLKGLTSPATRDLTDGLVGLAIFAAMSQGDFVTATLVPLFLDLGRLFEERSALGSRAAIEGLLRLRAPVATRLSDSGEEEVSADSLKTGDRVLVRPGQRLPADGVIESGYSALDQAAVTGESRFEDVGPEDSVYAGTVNLQGALEIRVTGVGQDSVLGRVVALLGQVETSRIPILRVLERLSQAWLPVVLTLAASVLFFTEDLDRAITVLIVAVPTALVLAGPAAVVAALATATRRRVLVKSAALLERAHEVDTLLLDKTGTVTEGQGRLDRLHPQDGVSEQELLQVGASVGQQSLHPVSQALVQAAQGQELLPILSSRELPGQGVEARVEGHTLRLGRGSWLQSCGLELPADRPEGSGAWVARDERVLGFVALADRPREGARDALDRLRAQGFQRIVLLTGDRRAEAERVAAALGITEVRAELLPEQKLEHVRAEQAQGHKVLMIGDGVNDALALGQADLGVAIGARINEVALGGADVALLSDRIDLLPELIDLADRTRSVMRQNALLAVLLALGMFVAAGVGWLGPLAGALLHNLGALLVVLSSARLLRDPTQAD